jgi:cephalosporin-C deacetylase-like acetyl esterase
VTSIRVSGLKLAEIAETSVVVQWKTDVHADTQLEYEPALRYGGTFSQDRMEVVMGPELVYHHSQRDPVLTTDHSITMTGLSPGTGYYVRVRSSAASDRSLWRDLVFTTRVEAPSIPPSGSNLKDFLLAQVDTLARAQEVARDQIRSISDLRAYQDMVKASFIEALGGLPEKTPLNAQVIDVIDRGDYVIENVVFESLPSFFVPGNLYVPKNLSEPLPGILGVCGHALDGKSERRLHQMLNVNLVRRGYVVFQIDPPGQNEMGWDGTPWTHWYGVPCMHYNASGYAHSLMALNALLVGQSVTRYFLWDGIRAIDYLVSRPEVNSEQIGVWGCSGGGSQTMCISAVDERVKVAVPMSRLFDPVATMKGPHEGYSKRGGASLTEETYPLTWLYGGLSFTSVLSLIAPRTLVIVAASRDGEALWTTQSIYDELRGIYDRIGASDRVCLGTIAGPHCGNPVRQFAYWAFNREFGKEEEGISETHQDLLPSSLGPDGIRQHTPLDVAPHSSVVLGFGSDTIHTKIVERAAALAQQRPNPEKSGGWETYCSEVRHKVYECLGIPEKHPSPVVTRGNTIDRGTYCIRRLSCQADAGVPVRIEICIPKSQGAGQVMLYLRDKVPPTGDILAGAQEMYEYVNKGCTVLALEVRGLNDTAPLEDEMAFRISIYHARRVHDSVAVGRPLFGQRVLDVLAAITVLDELADASNGVILVGDGVGGLWGIYAALLDNRIASLAVRNCLSTYQRVVENAFVTWIQNDRESSIVVPGALRFYDLPDLVSVLTPRHVRISRAVDGSNNLLNLPTLVKDYARALRRYDAQGLGHRLVISDRNDLLGWEGLGEGI